MALDPKDLKALTDALVKALENSTKGVHSTSYKKENILSDANTRKISEAKLKYQRALASNTKNLSGLSKSREFLNEIIKKVTHHELKSLETSKEGTDLIRKYNKNLEKSSSYLKVLYRQYREIASKDLVHQGLAIRRLNKQSDKVTDSLSKTVRNASLLGSALLTSHKMINRDTVEYSVYMDDLSKAIKNLDKSFLNEAGFIDDFTQDIKDNLSADDFAQLRVRLGQAQEILSSSFSGLKPLDTANLQQLQAGKELELTKGSSNRIRDALTGAALQLSAAGHSFSDLNLKHSLIDENGKVNKLGLTELTDVKLATLAQSISNLNNEIVKSANSLDNEAKKRNNALTNFYSSYWGAEKAGNKLASLFGSSLSAAAGWARIIQATKQAYSELVDFNTSGIAKSFRNVQIEAIKMGLSFGDMTRFLQENKRTLAAYGSSDFDSLRGQLTDTFKTFGYTAAQSAEMIGPGIESAIDIGLNIRSPDKLNNFIDSAMKSFQGISAVVKETGAEYLQLNAELFKTREISDTILGLSSDQAELYTKSLEKQRNKLVLDGLSLQQAQEIVKMQEAARRERVEQRISNAGNLLLQLQQQGWNPTDAMDAMNAVINGVRATENEKAMLDKAMQEIGQQREQQIQSGNLATEVFYQQANVGGLESIIESYNKRKLAMQAKANISPEEAAKRQAEAKPDDTFRFISDNINSVSATLKNSFGMALIGAAGSLASLAISSSVAAASLSGVSVAAGGASVLSALGSTISGGIGKVAGALGITTAAGWLASKFGTPPIVAPTTVQPTVQPASPTPSVGASKGIGSKLMSGAGLGAASFVSDMAANALISSGHTTLGGLASVASSGLTGAALGSLAGPIGTAIGGVLGAGYGLYNNLDNFIDKKHDRLAITQPNQLTDQAAINKSSSLDVDKLLNVSDEQAKQQLAIIAENMISAVQLLQKMSSNTSDMVQLNKTSYISKNDLSSNLGQIPTTNSYITGRNIA